jgi:hypothetical protein
MPVVDVITNCMIFPLLMIIACLVGTGGILIRCYNSHTKLTYRQLNKFRNYFNKTPDFKVAITEMHPRIPLGTGRGSQGVRGAHFGNR